MNGWFGREAINEFIAQHINEHRGFFLEGGFSASDEELVAAPDLGSLPVAVEAAPAHCGNRLRTRAIVIGKGGSGPRYPERELSAQLIGPIQSVRIYDLDGVGAVEQLAADIKAHWLMHTSPDAP